MAEVIAKFDSETKSLTVTIDGNAVGDLQSIDFCRRGYCYGENDSEENEFRFSLLQMSADEATKLQTVTRTSASAGGVIVTEAAPAAPSAKTVSDIAEFLSRR